MSHRFDTHYGPPQTIIPTDNDVLCGRGVNIAAHPGNERFRTLITTRSDDKYCEIYTVTEKRAVAEEIVRHINNLDPPGRFLKREGRGHVTRGLNGPWEELSHKDAVKKACQALRDCNRPDRETYAQGVAAPEDVQAVAHERAVSGISGKEYAQKAATVIQEETQAQLREAMSQAGIPEDQVEEQLRRKCLDPTYTIPGFAMTPNGTFQPIGANIPIGGMHSIGPDGLPVLEGGVSVSIDPATLYNQVIPPVGLQVPHPMFDIGPIDMEAAREARRIAGYRHPTLDPPEDEEADEENAEFKAGVAAAEEAAAAVAGLDTDQHEGISAEIAEAIAQDATDSMVQDPMQDNDVMVEEPGEEDAVKEEKHDDDDDAVKGEGYDAEETEMLPEQEAESAHENIKEDDVIV
ncbi:hypothetical protein ACHAWO_008017 [Cyclotella atomus]|uniref:DUF6824 domain-containing protein n=1 Tax=Cyclotella atomus TaxID=382360 RepID=A0ABD3PDD3_9STRA